MAGTPTAASLDNVVYDYGATFDGDLHLTSTTLKNHSLGTTLFGSTRSYDAVGNVSTVATTLSTGTDYQAFCYDEQDRLTWASGAPGAIPCGGTNGTGSLTSAYYTQSFSYDSLGRLTTGPLGSYTYGDGAHLHAATAVGSYTASYDAAGDMQCRAPTGATTCTGTPTGATLTYDNARQLIAWTDNGSPASTDAFAYDGEGNRVAQDANGATTYYLGAWEEVTGSTVTKYFPVGNLPTPEKVGTALYFLADDGLDSVQTALDGSGNSYARALYLPFGGARYTNGSMPTSKAFTGQRADTATGLDYYNARYYDPVLGQFASADSVNDGLNRYAYVGNNPETHNDPTGHCWLVCAVIAAVATAVVTTAVSAVVQQVTTGQVNWGQAIATGASVGLAVGAAIALGPAAALVGNAVGGGIATAVGGGAVATSIATSAVAGAVVGAGSAAVGQVSSNLLTGKPWSDGLGQAVLLGAVTGGAGGALGGALTRAGNPALKFIGRFLGGDAGDTGASGGPNTSAPDTPDVSPCPLSFSPDTLVATPSGEKAIAALAVGDQVDAFDPVTGKASAQTVEATYINHDTDLLDVTLRVSSSAPIATAANAATGTTNASTVTQQAVANSPTRDETVHTTASHPWLSADKGWVVAGQLRVGEPVRLLDGRTAMVVATVVVLGAADMWDLTVSNVHDFAVGTGQFVVHNCPDPNGGAGGNGGGFSPRSKYLDANGNLTDGVHTVNPTDTAPHLPLTAGPGKSVFLSGVDAQTALLDAAQYADENGLWQAPNFDQATVYVTNGPVGIIGRTGELTNWLTVSRALGSRVFHWIHGWPSGPP